MFDYSDVYIVVKGTITAEGTNTNIRTDKKLTFKNNATFRSCISKINNIFIDIAEDPDTVTSMYNLLEYIENYSMTSGSLCNYYRDEGNDDATENNADNYEIKNNNIITI